jgi:hypothetical protein
MCVHIIYIVHNSACMVLLEFIHMFTCTSAEISSLIATIFKSRASTQTESKGTGDSFLYSPTMAAQDTGTLAIRKWLIPLALRDSLLSMLRLDEVYTIDTTTCNCPSASLPLNTLSVIDCSTTRQG